jgi:hypothetical protein
LRRVGCQGRIGLPFGFDARDDEQQVPPLRYAPVGMTPLLGTGKRAWNDTSVQELRKEFRMTRSFGMDKRFCYNLIPPP